MSYHKKSKFEEGNEIRFRQNQIELEKQKYDSALVKTAVIAAGAVTLDLLTQKAYAQAWGSQTDGFEDSIWNANSMFTLQEGIITSSNEFNGYLHLQKDGAENMDRVVTGEYPGEQTLTVKFSNTTPDNFTGYGIQIGNLIETNYAKLDVFRWDPNFFFWFRDEGGTINTQIISQTGPFYLKLEKNSSNTVQAYVSEDGIVYNQIPGITEVPSNTAGFIRGSFSSSTASYEAQEFNFSGPLVPNKNNEASQAPLDLINLGVLFTTLLTYGITKIKRKINSLK